MTKTTLLLLVEGTPIHRVLLGYKKTGFGKGKYMGIGGKIEPGETAVQATLREMYEETGVVVLQSDLHFAGHIAYYFPTQPEWDLTVCVFLANRWQNQPEEHDEIRPEWFATNQLPFHSMWDDAQYWYPHVLSTKTIDATFVFKSDNQTVDTHTLTIT